MKKLTVTFLLAMLTATLIACGTNETEATGDTATTDSTLTDQNDTTENTEETTSDYVQDNEALTFDASAWNYDSENDVYWQIGVSYSSNPEAIEYETMGIYVPGAYMDATLNEDGVTYTCVINTENEMNGYTAETAPIILPVDTPGYIAQAAPTEYDYNSISDYINSGFVYVIAGMRGRGSMTGASEEETYSGGAPYGITDLKAAIRYYRFNEDILPGSTDSFFSYGMSGGGAQSALIGATGDSELYYPYLESIGAAMYSADGEILSDAVAGSMDWCPITSLDYADEAYEWNMGQYFTTDTREVATFTSALSDDMAEAFAEYINELGLVDEDGNVLTLEESEDGIYNSGSYYDYILSQIELSLNNFLSDTTFPYEYTGTTVQVGNTAESGEAGVDLADQTGTDTTDGMTFGGPDGTTEGTADGTADFAGTDGTGDFDGGDFGGTGGFGGAGGFGGSQESVTYETAQDYIDSLNENGVWIVYDAETNTASITSIEDFVINCKNATKTVGAFDSVDASQGENNLFGNGQNEYSHFDATEAALLEANQEEYSMYEDWDDSYLTAFAEDLAATDALGVSTETRLNMYNPMYYLSDYYEGYGTSTVAKYWRIRTGINQTDTALTVEANLNLALLSNDQVESVDYAQVWGQPHTTAERTGTSTENFIAWVNECLASE